MKYFCLLSGFSLGDVVGQFMVVDVVGFTNHMRAVLGCWCAQNHRKAITNLSHIVPFYYAILLLDYKEFHAGKKSQL